MARGQAWSSRRVALRPALSLSLHSCPLVMSSLVSQSDQYYYCRLSGLKPIKHIALRSPLTALSCDFDLSVRLGRFVVYYECSRRSDDLAGAPTRSQAAAERCCRDSGIANGVQRRVRLSLRFSDRLTSLTLAYSPSMSYRLLLYPFGMMAMNASYTLRMFDVGNGPLSVSVSDFARVRRVSVQS